MRAGALAVDAALHLFQFLPFIRESGCTPIVYSDNAPVVKACRKMQQGAYSASPRVSTCPHEGLNQGAEARHLKRIFQLLHGSAEPTLVGCRNQRCQVCSWAADKEGEVVRRLTLDDDQELASTSPIPFLWVLGQKTNGRQRPSRGGPPYPACLCSTNGQGPLKGPYIPAATTWCLPGRQQCLAGTEHQEVLQHTLRRGAICGRHDRRLHLSQLVNLHGSHTRESTKALTK